MEKLIIGTREFSSRLLVGTGKYKDFQETQDAIVASGAQVVTVAIRRTNIGQNKDEPNLLDFLNPEKFIILPNTAGCYNVDDAVRTCNLARELLDGHNLVKLEVLGDSSLKGNLNATGITTLSGNVTLNAGASSLMQLKFRNNVTGFGANDGADVAYSTNSHGMFFSAYESAGHMIFQTAGNNLNNRSLIISNTGVVTLQRNQENMLVATPNSDVK